VHRRQTPDSRMKPNEPRPSTHLNCAARRPAQPSDASSPPSPRLLVQTTPLPANSGSRRLPGDRAFGQTFVLLNAWADTLRALGYDFVSVDAKKPVAVITAKHFGLHRHTVGFAIQPAAGDPARLLTQAQNVVGCDRLVVLVLDPRPLSGSAQVFERETHPPTAAGHGPELRHSALSVHNRI